MTDRIKCSDFDSVEKELLSPYTYITQVKGKEFRLKIILAFNYWLKVPQDMLNRILDILNMSYSAGLLFDDIQDRSIVRRGLPAAHRVYGVPLTLNTCLHIFFLTFNKLIDLNVEAAKIYSEEFLNIIRGQGLNIYWRENFTCPTEAEHKEMSKSTVGSVFMQFIRILQLFSEDNRDYGNFNMLLGQYYQIRNDYCNLCHQEILDEWPSPEENQAQVMCFCEDLSEGTFTLPIIHALQTPEGGEIKNILRQRTRDVALKKHCMYLLEKAGSFQYTRDTLAALEKEIREELSRLGGNPKMENVLDELFICQNNEKK